MVVFCVYGYKIVSNKTLITITVAVAVRVTPWYGQWSNIL